MAEPDVKIVFGAETSEATRDIENLGESLNTLSSTAMKENLLDLKKAATGAFSDIASVVGDLVSIAAEDEEVMMRLDQQIANVGDAAAVSKDDILTLAEQLSKTSGFDDEALVEGQTTLLRFGNLSKEQFDKATRAAADLAAMTGTDLPSAFQQVAIALDNPENGLGRLGRKVGSLTDEQQKAIDKMIEMGDEAGAQGLLLDILAGKVGGAANAFGETFTGKVAIAQTSIENFKSALGDDIIQNLPQWAVSLGVGAKEANESLGPMVDSLADLALVMLTISKGGGLKEFPVLLAAMKGGLIALASAITVGLLNEFGKFASSLGKTIGDALGITLPEELDKMRDMLIEHGPFSKEAFMAAAAAIAAGLNTLIDAIKKALGIASPSKVFMEIGKAMIDGLVEGFQAGVLALDGVIRQALSKAFDLAKQGIEKWYEDQWTTVINASRRRKTDTTQPATQEFVPPTGLTESLAKLEEFRLGAAALQDQLLSIALSPDPFMTLKAYIDFAVIKFNEMPLAFEDGSGRIANALAALPLITDDMAQKIVLKLFDLKSKFQEMAGQMVTVGASIVNGLWVGIQGAWDTFVYNVVGSMTDLINNIKAMIGFGSPAKEYMKIGASMAQGIQIGFGSGMGLTSGAISSALTPGSFGGGGHGGAVINVTYAPAMSTASPAEFEAAFVPLVDAALRRVNRRR